MHTAFFFVPAWTTGFGTYKKLDSIISGLIAALLRIYCLTHGYLPDEDLFLCVPFDFLLIDYYDSGLS